MHKRDGRGAGGQWLFQLRWGSWCIHHAEGLTTYMPQGIYNLHGLNLCTS